MVSIIEISCRMGKVESCIVLTITGSEFVGFHFNLGYISQM